MIRNDSDEDYEILANGELFEFKAKTEFRRDFIDRFEIYVKKLNQEVEPPEKVGSFKLMRNDTEPFFYGELGLIPMDETIDISTNEFSIGKISRNHNGLFLVRTNDPVLIGNRDVLRVQRIHACNRQVQRSEYANQYDR